jgi:type III secretory pathway component EscV
MSLSPSRNFFCSSDVNGHSVLWQIDDNPKEVFNLEKMNQDISQPDKENKMEHQIEIKQESYIESKEGVHFPKLQKRLDTVENSILGIYKTLNLMEKMTEQNTEQLKKIIQICENKKLIKANH